MTKDKSGKNIVLHKFAHYQFELELHPEDDPEGLNKNLTPPPSSE